jgi:hypothetical protein
MRKAIILAGVIVCAPLLTGCLVMDVAGAAVGATGAVVGGAIDLVTTSKDEQNAKDVARLKKENEELKKQNKAQRQ